MLEPASPQSSVFPFPYTGWVVNNKDPRGLGRLQVRVPLVYGPVDAIIGNIPDDSLPWAAPFGMPAGGSQATGGIDWLPNANDRVMVLFLDGMPEKPMWTYANQAMEQVPVFTAHQYESNQSPVARAALTRFGHLVEMRPNQVGIASAGGSLVQAVDSTPQQTSTSGVAVTNQPPAVTASGTQWGPLAAGSGASLGIPNVAGMPSWIGVTPTVGGTAAGGVFGTVPNGSGGIVTDPKNNGIGAWGTITGPSNASVQGASVTPADFVASNIPYAQWKYSMVQVTSNTTGKTVTVPVVGILGTAGRVDFTYATYTTLGGPQTTNGGLIPGGVTWKIIPPGGSSTGLQSNDPSSVGQRMDSIGGSPASTGPQATIPGVNPQGGPAPGNVSGQSGKRVTLAVPSGPRVDLFDDASYINLYAPTSIMYSAPNHWHTGNDYQLDCSRVGIGATPVAVALVDHSPYGTNLRALPAPLTTIGGTYAQTVDSWLKLWSKDTMELIGGNRLAIASGFINLNAVTSVAVSAGASLLIQGASVGASQDAASASAARGSFVPNTQIWSVNTVCNFQTAWTVTGPALNAQFTLQNFTTTASAAITLVSTAATITATAQQNIALSSVAGSLTGAAQQNIALAAQANASLSAVGECDVSGTASASFSSVGPTAILGNSVSITGTTTVTVNGTTAITMGTAALAINCTGTAIISAGGHSVTISAAGIEFV